MQHQEDPGKREHKAKHIFVWHFQVGKAGLHGKPAASIFLIPAAFIKRVE
jgi:hypothetical protein